MRKVMPHLAQVLETEPAAAAAAAATVEDKPSAATRLRTGRAAGFKAGNAAEGDVEEAESASNNFLRAEKFGVVGEAFAAGGNTSLKTKYT